MHSDAYEEETDRWNNENVKCSVEDRNTVASTPLPIFICESTDTIITIVINRKEETIQSYLNERLSD